jgi:site-specific DNA-methyltransferase (adenine-specific)/site-specific DNA-methyltransferase (cytosine-N4-specific)
VRAFKKFNLWRHKVYLAVISGENDKMLSDILADTESDQDGLWRINPEASPYRHVAMWPRALARQMLLPTTRPGDTILDPFAGSGTTGEVAFELGLKAILIESSPQTRIALNDRIRGLNRSLPF